jgi:hypothetical protein
VKSAWTEAKLDTKWALKLATGALAAKVENIPQQ